MSLKTRGWSLLRSCGVGLTAPEQAPEQPEYLEISFKGGDPVALNGELLSPATLLARLNAIGGTHGIGRADIVENRYVGMKSRGCYETPGGTLLLKARRAIESLTLILEAAHLKERMDATLCCSSIQWLLVFPCSDGCYRRPLIRPKRSNWSSASKTV